MRRARKKRDKVPAINVGNAGEHYVVAELLRRGWNAGLMPRGTANHDVLAAKGKHQVRLRVKTKGEAFDNWQFRKDDKGNVYRNVNKDGHDFTILVALRNDQLKPDYFVVPTDKLNNATRRRLRKVLRRQGRTLSPHDHMKFPQREYVEFLAPYREAWKKLATSRREQA